MNKFNCSLIPKMGLNQGVRLVKRYFIFAALIAFLPMANGMDSDGDGISDAIEASNGADPFSDRVLTDSCMLENNEVSCWTGDDVPPLDNPFAMSSYRRAHCAIDENGIACWGASNWYGSVYNQPAPQLSNPVAVSTGDQHICAIDDTGVVCWGENTYGQTDVPPLTNPVTVSAGEKHTCALDDNGVTCWGITADACLAHASWCEYHGQTDVPSLSNPVVVTSGMYHSCALDDNGVTCWGVRPGQEVDYLQATVPPLSNPRAVDAGEYSTCALDDHGAICWGWNGEEQIAYAEELQEGDYPAGTTAVARLNVSNVVALAVNYPSHCLLTTNGATCRGQGRWDVFNYFGLNLEISAPASSECTQPNAAPILATLQIEETGYDPSVSTQWFLNDELQGSGNDIALVAPLGLSRLSAEVTTASGYMVAASMVIAVEDTEKPKLRTQFTDDKGHKILKAELYTAKKVYFSHSATDVCDPDVRSEVLMGDQLDPVSELKFRKKNDEVEFNSRNHTIKVIAKDASGNKRRRKVSIPQFIE